VRITDVARRAGTSVATVSHVLRGSGKYVLPELAARVLEAARALDYRPNSVARALRTRQTGEIGVVVPDLRDHGYAFLLKGFGAVAQQHGFGLLLEDSEGSWAREADRTRHLIGKQVEGLVVAPVADASAAVRHALRAAVPVVLVGGTAPGADAPAVLADVEAGAFATVSHLFDLGRRRVGFLAGPLDTTLRRECFTGYRAALREHAVSFEPALVCTQPSDLVGGFKAMMQLLRSRVPPDAVFVVEHSMALGAVKALATSGYRCPADVALAAVGDYEWAAAMTPSLTVMSLPAYEMGCRAASLLVELLRGGSPAAAPAAARVPSVYRLPTRLIVRGSTDPAREELVWDERDAARLAV
jgi:LacI family transcriptional regulator